MVVRMFYVYILQIEGIKDKHYYIGYTADLRKRMGQHLRGETKTTKDRNPKLIYYEAFESQELAEQREKAIKTSGSVYNALMKRLGKKLNGRVV